MPEIIARINRQSSGSELPPRGRQAGSSGVNRPSEDYFRVVRNPGTNWSFPLPPSGLRHFQPGEMLVV